MTRKRVDPRQILLGLDEGKIAAAPGSLNWETELRAALAEAIAGSGKRRAEIAAEMETALGSDPHYPVSVSTLDAWTAPSRTDWRFPLHYLPAFVRATGAAWLLARVAAKCGHKVVAGRDALAAELGALIAQEEDLRARKTALRRQMRGSGA